MAHIQKRTRKGKPAYVARYLDPEGQERSQSFHTEREAERFLPWGRRQPAPLPSPPEPWASPAQ
jgi:hypothetical protein